MGGDAISKMNWVFIWWQCRHRLRDLFFWLQAIQVDCIFVLSCIFAFYCCWVFLLLSFVIVFFYHRCLYYRMARQVIQVVCIIVLACIFAFYCGFHFCLCHCCLLSLLSVSYHGQASYSGCLVMPDRAVEAAQSRPLSEIRILFVRRPMKK